MHQIIILEDIMDINVTTTIGYSLWNHTQASTISPIYIIIPSILLGLPVIVLACICCKASVCQSCKSPDINIHKIKEERKRMKYRGREALQLATVFVPRAAADRTRQQYTGQLSSHANYNSGHHRRTSVMELEDLDANPHHDSSTVAARLADRKRKSRIRRHSMQIEPLPPPKELIEKNNNDLANEINEKKLQKKTSKPVSNGIKLSTSGSRRIRKYSSNGPELHPKWKSQKNNKIANSDSGSPPCGSPDSSYGSHGNRSSAPSVIELENYSPEPVHNSNRLSRAINLDV